MSIAELKEHVFFDLLNQAPIAFAVASLDGNVIFGNNYFSEMIKRDPEELYKLHYKDITHPDDLDKDSELFSKLLSGEISYYQFEKRYINKVGETIWGNLFATLLPLHSGESVFLGIIQNLQARKSAEEHLTSSEKRYKAVLDHSSEMICRYTPDFRLTYGNRAFLEFFNLTKADYNNFNVGELCSSKEELKKFNNNIFNLKGGKKSGPVEYFFVVNGKKIYHKWQAIGIYGNKNELVEIQSIGRDITNEKEENEKIKWYNTLFKEYAEDLKETNKNLEELNNLFKSVQKNTKTGIWNIEVDTKEIFWSDEIYKIHELDSEKKISIEEAISFYHPDHKIAVEEIFCNSMENHQPFNYEAKIITAKNTLKWIRVIGSPINEKGEIKTIQGIFQDITEKKTAQLKAEERQDNIEAIVENTCDQIWSVDKNYKVLVANKAFKEMMKKRWNKEVSEGDSLLFEDLPDEVLNLWKSYYDRAFKGERFKVEYIPRKNSSVMMDISLNPIYDHDQVIGVNIISRDITALKRKETEIKKQEEYLLQIQKEAKIAAWRWNKTKNIFEYTDTLLEIFEFDAEEVNPENIIEKMRSLVHNDDQEATLETRKNYTEKNKPFKVENRIITKNGNVKYIKIIGSECHKDKFTKEIFQLGSTQDITDIKLQELNLLENQEWVNALTSNTILGVALAKFDGKLFKINNTMAEMLGYELKELQGFTVFDITHPDDQNLTRNYFHKISSGEKNAFQTEKRYITKSGSIIWVLLNVSVVKDVNKKPMYVIGQFQDITDRKNEEVRIKRIVKERTAQLEAINKELEEFNYSVSHDLRAPLRSINGFSSSLLEDYGDMLEVEQKMFLNKINQASIRMSEILDGFQRLSKISLYKIKKRPVDLSKLIKKIISSITIIDNYPKVKFCVEADLRCQGDEQLLSILLENLISNACKYSSKELSPKVTIGKKRISGREVFFVKDNGVGFNMDHHKNLFRVFNRLHSPEDFPGTGIGLATVKKIIDRHDGKVWAEAKEGEGAAFFFIIS